MMHRDHEDMAGVVQAEQGTADQGTSGEVEWALGFLSNEAWNVLRITRNIRNREFDGQFESDDLNGFAFDDREGRAQDFMSPNHFIQAIFQLRHLKRPVETNGARNIIGRFSRLQLINEPQAFL